jgi:hypothetical protein
VLLVLPQVQKNMDGSLYTPVWLVYSVVLWTPLRFGCVLACKDQVFVLNKEHWYKSRPPSCMMGKKMMSRLELTRMIKSISYSSHQGKLVWFVWNVSQCVSFAPIYQTWHCSSRRARTRCVQRRTTSILLLLRWRMARQMDTWYSALCGLKRTRERIYILKQSKPY